MAMLRSSEEIDHIKVNIVHPFLRFESLMLLVIMYADEGSVNIKNISILETSGFAVGKIPNFHWNSIFFTFFLPCFVFCNWNDVCLFNTVKSFLNL